MIAADAGVIVSEELIGVAAVVVVLVFDFPLVVVIDDVSPAGVVMVFEAVVVALAMPP